jgi:hypothetical protein
VGGEHRKKAILQVCLVDVITNRDLISDQKYVQRGLLLTAHRDPGDQSSVLTLTSFRSA